MVLAGHIQAWFQFHFEVCFKYACSSAIEVHPKHTRCAPEAHLIFHAWVCWAESLLLDGTVGTFIIIVVIHVHCFLLINTF